MDFWERIDGSIKAELVSADTPRMLRILIDYDIELGRIQFVDSLTCHLTIARTKWNLASQLCQKYGASLKIVQKSGGHWKAALLLRRLLLISGLTILTFLTFFIPTRVFFIEVQGNDHIPGLQILEKAQNCGITFGSSRREVRSESVKNELLHAMPELQWAGINTVGCTAIISVQERTAANPAPTKAGVSRMIASRDGIISRCTALSGNLLCKPGQAVEKGEILISGYTDCGIAIRAQRARGEIYAKTERHLTVFMPSYAQYRTKKTEHRKKYGIIIGKNRINFYKNSGISCAGCAKIYEETYMKLPGGFQLPVRVFSEETISYDLKETVYDPDSSRILLRDAASAYLNNQMVAGMILDQEESFSAEPGVLRQDIIYSCEEMIGREQSEEILHQYGESNGTNR